MAQDGLEGKHWYVIHTYSGYENKVKQNLELRAQSFGMEDNILQVFIPEQEVTEKAKDGESKTVSKKVFPGYVLVEMVMSDDSWYVVRNTPGVTGFIGSHGAGSKPVPLLEEEVEAILNPEGVNTRRREIDLEIGERIKVNEGAFEGMEGVVTGKEPEKGKVHVNIELFGRETAAELDYDQVSKVWNQ